MNKGVKPKANANPKSKRRYKRETFKYISYLEDFDQEHNQLKRICSLTNESIWYNTMVFMGMFSMYDTLADGIVSIRHESYNLVKTDLYYMCDGTWIIDHVLRIISIRINKKRLTVCKGLEFALGLLSSIPLEVFYFHGSFVKTMLTMNRILKIIYVINIFRMLNSRVKCSVLTRSVQAICLMFFCLMFLGFIFTYMNCYNDDCHGNDSTDDEHLYKIMYAICGAVTMRGFGIEATGYFQHNTIIDISTILLFVFIFCMYTAYVTFNFFIGALHKSNFRFRFLSIKMILKRNRLYRIYMDKVDDFFDCMWRVCRGYHGYMAETRIEYPFLQFESILPQAYRTEIQMDICMAALVHSILFSDLNTDFLKELSCYIKQQIYVSGQYVFHKDELKDKMIYVFQGTITIVSNEDGETPLITFTEGTCLAETSILIPYKSIYKCKCVTTCILQVLERQQFLEVARRYVRQFRKIRMKIQQRYAYVRYLHNLKGAVDELNGDMFNRSLSMAWLTNTLHKIMGSKSRDAAAKHAIQTFNLRCEIDDTIFKNRLYTAKYLSIYVLAERIRLTRDTLFIKSNFPYILRPNTKLILTWEIIICIIACVATIQLPFNALIEKERNAIFYASIYLYTMIWWTDVLVQLRTAVKLSRNQQIVSDMRQILIIKLKNFVFMVDLISCIPLEYLSGIFMVENVNTLYLNRIFKLLRVIKLLKNTEHYISTNPIVSRIISVTVILFFSSYLLGCIYFNIKCLRECDAKEMLILIFYALQIVTGVSAWVPEYADLSNYAVMNIVMFLFLAIGFSVVYGYIFSAFAFSEIHHSTICYNTNKLLQAIKFFEPKLERRIKSLVYTETDIYNGLNFIDNGYLYQSLPKPLVGILFKNVLHITWMMNLPIFYGLPKYVVVDIMQSAAITNTICPETIIFHVGDLLKELLILSQGCCEKICGVNQNKSKIHAKTCLNDMEVMLNMPCRSSIKCITHCKLIIVDFLKLRRVMLKYPNIPSIEYTLMNIGSIRNKIVKYNLKLVHFANYKYLNLARRKSFYRHIQFIQHTKLNNNRLIKLWNFIILSTMDPEGKLFMRWEYCRCFSAVIASILYPTTFLIFLPKLHPVKLILLMTDAIGIIDIYLRFHVCYYNEKGILITRASLTSLHYLNTSFVIDLIGILPTQYIITMNKYILITTTHLLQLHRYYGLMNYKLSNRSVPTSKFYMLSLIPFFIVFLNIASSVYVSVECRINTNLPYDRCMNCNVNSIFGNNKMQENITPIKAHLYAFYMIINTVTTISFQGYNAGDSLTMIMASIFAIFGFYWNIFFTVTAFRFFMLQNIGLQLESIVKLTVNKFIAKYKVPKAIDKSVNRFLRTGILMEKFNVHNAITMFPNDLRRDILFEKFGKVLLKYCLCNADDFVPFIRNILLHSQHKYVLTNCLVYSINDILDETIFIYSGTVEFIIPHGEVACLLQRGSIIGNLCCLTYNRMMANIVAIGNVEMITVKTTKFFQILQHFPETQEEFNRVRRIHWNHIPGYKKLPYVNRFTHTSKYMFNISTVVWHQIFILYLLFVGNYLPQIYYLYQVSVSELSTISIVVNLFLDVSFAVSIFSDFFIPLETTSNVILQVKVLTRFWLKKPTFWLDFFAMLPLNYPLHLVDMSPKTYYYMYVLLRFNVMLRTFHLFRYSRRVFVRLKINVVHTKIILLMLVAALTIFCTLAIFMLLSDVSEINMNVNISRQFLIETTTLKRLYIFGEWFNVITDAFTHTSQTYYYPVGIAYVIIIIVMVLFIMTALSVFYAIVISFVFGSKQIQWSYMYALDQLEAYLRFNRVSAGIVERIHEYTEVLWKNTMGIKYSQIFSKLPTKMQQTLLSYMVGDLIFNKNSIFCNCHEDFKRQLMPLLNVAYYLRGDYVQTKGTIDNTMYWVRTGSVVRLSEMNNYSHDIINIFTDGMCFGISQGILHLVPHMFSYKATSNCCVISLKRNDWEHLIAFFPASRAILSKDAKKYFYKERNQYLELHNLPYDSDTDYEDEEEVVQEEQFKDDPYSEASLRTSEDNSRRKNK